MTERLTIARLAHRGDGIAETPAGRSMCLIRCPGKLSKPSAFPAIPTGGIAAGRETSPERIAPICPHFGVCGGCAVQHWRADRYSDWKRGLVVAALAQAGLDGRVDA